MKLRVHPAVVVLAVAGVVAAGLGWQASFVALAILTGAVALILWLRLPPEPIARDWSGAPAGSFAHGLRKAPR